jgi:hypothetical protein
MTRDLQSASERADLMQRARLLSCRNMSGLRFVYCPGPSRRWTAIHMIALIVKSTKSVATSANRREGMGNMTLASSFNITVAPSEAPFLGIAIIIEDKRRISLRSLRLQPPKTGVQSMVVYACYQMPREDSRPGFRNTARVVSTALHDHRGPREDCLVGPGRTPRRTISSTEFSEMLNLPANSARLM